jgi:uncharacterized protein YyaL (SSP411 family)
MKKTIFAFSLLIAALLFSNSTNAQELKWYGFNEGYTKAKAENKLMLIDIYTEWCGWCKQMDKTTYSNADVIKLVNKDFIAIKLNPEVNAQYTYNGKQYTGQQLVDVLTNNKLTGYPSSCFGFPKSNKTYMEVGYQDKDEMSQLLVKYATMESNKD